MSTHAETIPPIEGIEQLPEPPDGSKPFTRVYYRDSADALVKAASSLPVRENHFISPEVGWPKRIYRKPESSK